MYKNYKVVCSKCGWEGFVDEDEMLQKQSQCPICNKKNTLRINDEKQIQDIVGQDLIYSMRENIKHLGKEKTWEIINHLVGETRLNYMLVYLSALQNDDEASGDNFSDLEDK